MTAGTATAEGQAVPWWVVLLQGGVALIVGILLITSPGATMTFLILLLGIYWLISGIFSIVSIFVDSSQWGWKLIVGILGIIAGIIVIQHPLVSTIVVPTITVWLIGLLGIVIGVISIIQAFQGGGWGVGILGVLSILFGIVLVANPLIGALALPWVLGIFGIVGGIAAIIYSFRLRNA